MEFFFLATIPRLVAKFLGSNFLSGKSDVLFSSSYISLSRESQDRGKTRRRIYKRTYSSVSAAPFVDFKHSSPSHPPAKGGKEISERKKQIRTMNSRHGHRPVFTTEIIPRPPDLLFLSLLEDEIDRPTLRDSGQSRGNKGTNELSMRANGRAKWIMR